MSLWALYLLASRAHIFNGVTWQSAGEADIVGAGRTGSADGTVGPLLS